MSSTGARVPEDRNASTAAVKALHARMCEAMVLKDAAELEGILADGYTLTHMTGYVQPKADWLRDIETDRMQYHSMDTVEVAVGRDGSVPVLTARTLTDATIWGGHGTWRLQLRSRFERHDDGWIFTRTVASTW